MSTPLMRAKIRVASVNPPVVTVSPGCDMAPMQTMQAHPVARSESYPADGSDENNSFAKWSPSGDFKLAITNPALANQIREGDEFYVDFTRVPRRDPVIPGRDNKPFPQPDRCNA